VSGGSLLGGLRLGAWGRPDYRTDVLNFDP
jgi:hypothetical protein